MHSPAVRLRVEVRARTRAAPVSASRITETHRNCDYRIRPCIWESGGVGL
jgi:hypothetical protein